MAYSQKDAAVLSHKAQSYLVKEKQQQKAKREQLIKKMDYNPKTGAITFENKVCNVKQSGTRSPYIIVKSEVFYTNNLIFRLLDMDITDTGFVVVHENGFKTDNRLSNLMLLHKSDVIKYYFDKRQQAKHNPEVKH